MAYMRTITRRHCKTCRQPAVRVLVTKWAEEVSDFCADHGAEDLELLTERERRPPPGG